MIKQTRKMLKRHRRKRLSKIKNRTKKPKLPWRFIMHQVVRATFHLVTKTIKTTWQPSNYPRNRNKLSSLWGMTASSMGQTNQRIKQQHNQMQILKRQMNSLKRINRASSLLEEMSQKKKKLIKMLQRHQWKCIIHQAGKVAFSFELKSDLIQWNIK